MPTTLKLGYSPCPNDTFIFHALAEGLVDLGPFRPDIVLADVQELNEMAERGEPDMIKVSVHALASILDRYVLLRSGGAMGRGVGPVVVAGRPMEPDDLDGCRVAIPGSRTTANLLFGLFCRARSLKTERSAMVFDRIMDAVKSGQVDAGVLIHEGRFTYMHAGLSKVMDLGAWWEDYSGLPIPLGSIAVKRSLGPEAHALLDKALRSSLEYARAHPHAGREYIRSHAQEMDDAVIDEHIRTFVTDYSLDAGREGEEAIKALLAEAFALRGEPMPATNIFWDGETVG